MTGGLVNRMVASYNLFLLPHYSSYLSPRHNHIVVLGSCLPRPLSIEMGKSFRFLVKSSWCLIENAAVEMPPVHRIQCVAFYRSIKKPSFAMCTAVLTLPCLRNSALLQAFAG